MGEQTINEAKREIMEHVTEKERKFEKALQRIGDDVRELQKSDRNQDREISLLRQTIDTLKEWVCELRESTKNLPVIEATVVKIDKNLGKITWIALGYIAMRILGLIVSAP